MGSMVWLRFISPPPASREPPRQRGQSYSKRDFGTNQVSSALNRDLVLGLDLRLGLHLRNLDAQRAVPVALSLIHIYGAILVGLAGLNRRGRLRGRAGAIGRIDRIERQQMRGRGIPFIEFRPPVAFADEHLSLIHI